MNLLQNGGFFPFEYYGIRHLNAIILLIMIWIMLRIDDLVRRG